MLLYSNYFIPNMCTQYFDHTLNSGLRTSAKYNLVSVNSDDNILTNENIIDMI